MRSHYCPSIRIFLNSRLYQVIDDINISKEGISEDVAATRVISNDAEETLAGGILEDQLGIWNTELHS